MPTIETLTVDVNANTSQLTSGLKSAGVAIGVLAAGAAVSFKAWEESEKVAAQTGAVIKSTGGAANVTAQEVAALSESLKEKTAIDDEVIQSGQNMLLTFKNIRNEAGAGNDVFNQATKTLIDMSTALGTDPKQAAIQLGKALNDPVEGLTALTRVGVTFTKEQERQIAAMQKTGDVAGAQKVILKELNSEFGGSAKAQKTASAEAAVAFGDLQEALGGVVAGGLVPLMDAAMPVIQFLTESPGLTAALIGGITGIYVATKLWTVATQAATMAQRILAAASPWMLIAAAVVVLAVIIFKNWDKIKAFVLAVWDAIKAAAVVVFNAIKAVVMAYFNVYKSIFNVLKAITLAVWNAIRTVASTVWNAISGFVTNAIGRIRSAIAGVKSFILGVWNTIKSVASSVWNAIRDTAIGAFNTIESVFSGIINGIITGLNGVIRGINLVKPGEDIASIAPLADGGLVTRATLALVGEAGPEVVIPLDRLGDFGRQAVNVGVRLDRRRFSDDLDFDTEYRGH